LSDVILTTTRKQYTAEDLKFARHCFGNIINQAVPEYVIHSGARKNAGDILILRGEQIEQLTELYNMMLSLCLIVEEKTHAPT
jgi:hypothetical protein